MRIWSNSAVLQLIDAIAIAVAQGYMLVRSRLTSHPSPVLRVTAGRDAAVWNNKLLERELAIYRQERQRVPPRQRWHYTSVHRLDILQIMRLRNWTVTQAAERFVIHPNTVRSWLKELQSSEESSRLFTGIIWNRIHDAVRWTVHDIRRLCPEPECGTRTIARHIVRAAVQISRSSVQRILREEPQSHRPNRPAIVPPDGVEPDYLLAPKKINEVWHIDLLEYRLLWYRFSVAAVMEGYSRKTLSLTVFRGTPTTANMIHIVQSTIESFGKPRFIITDHGSQFQDRFESALPSIDVIKGKVRQPSFNGKAERLFRTFRAWLRAALLPLSTRPLQRRLDCFRDWYNEHRPHAALNGQTPNEACEGVELPASIPIRQAELCEVEIDVSRRSYRGDPHLPIVSVRIARKEAA